MSGQDTTKKVSFPETFDESSNAGRENSPTRKQSSENAVPVPDRTTLQLNPFLGPEQITQTQRYTHHRSLTAPPWNQEQQQWGPHPRSDSETSAAERDRSSPMGHQRSATMPTILVSTARTPSPLEIVVLREDLLFVPDLSRPALAPAAPPSQQVVQAPRISRLAGLQRAIRSAEARKGVYKAEGEKDRPERE